MINIVAEAITGAALLDFGAALDLEDVLRTYSQERDRRSRLTLLPPGQNPVV